MPNQTLSTLESVRGGSVSLLGLLVGLLAIIGIVASVVELTQATRKIPVQYAKRIVGRRMYGGANTHIPLRVNTAGVIPIIFASSVMILPATVAGFVPQTHPLASMGNWFRPSGWLYNIIYGIIIVFFTYFYTAVVLNPNDLAENMRKYGGFVPGIRPGKKTAEYIDRTLSRITLPGAIFLAMVAIFPDLVLAALNMPFDFGGTSVLIMVGVALDTLQQIESHLLMRHYEGLVKRGRLRGRQRM
jgi:preprotein translocase subunit SecY